MVDLDEERILQCVGDEMSILPLRLRRCLKTALQLVTNTTQPWDASRNVLVSEAFVRMFVEVCGHYRNHISTVQAGIEIFEVHEGSDLDFTRNFIMTHNVVSDVLRQFLIGSCGDEATFQCHHPPNHMVVCHWVTADPIPLLLHFETGHIYLNVRWLCRQDDPPFTVSFQKNTFIEHVELCAQL